MSKKKPYKLQITFHPEEVAAIEALKRATGAQTTAAEIIRFALGFYYWAQQQRKAGLNIGTLRNGKVIAQVTLPFELNLQTLVSEHRTPEKESHEQQASSQNTG